jgi:hypothetical protein
MRGATQAQQGMTFMDNSNMSNFMGSLKSCFKLEKMHIFFGLGRDFKKHN